MRDVHCTVHFPGSFVVHLAVAVTVDRFHSSVLTSSSVRSKLSKEMAGPLGFKIVGSCTIFKNLHILTV